MQGTVTVTHGETATVHTYIAPDAGTFVTTHLIEMPSELIVVDAQYLLPFAREAAELARSLKKPVTRLYISHEHPDHFFGAAEFGAEVPVYALPEIKDVIDARGDEQVSQARGQLGDLVPARATKPQRVVEPGEETIDGVRFEFRRVERAESETLLTIALPDESLLIAQDLLFNNVHLWIAERRFESWARTVAHYKRLPYQRLLPGHGRPGGPELYDRVLAYLTAAEPALDESTSGEQLKATLTKQFPDYDGVMLIDLQNDLYLFPATSQS